MSFVTSYIYNINLEVMHNSQFITELKAQRASLFEQIKLIDAMLRLNGVDLPSSEDGSYNMIENASECPYKKGATSQEKLAALLKEANRFLSINEMANMVHSYEPKIKVEDAKNSLGSAKNLLLKAGAIVKVQVGANNSNSFYGSPSWLKEDGQPLSEHMYNENAVVVKNKITI